MVRDSCRDFRFVPENETDRRAEGPEHVRRTEHPVLRSFGRSRLLNKIDHGLPLILAPSPRTEHPPPLPTENTLGPKWWKAPSAQPLGFAAEWRSLAAAHTCNLPLKPTLFTT